MNPLAPALTTFLNPHFLGFLGLYCQTLVYLVFDGIICSSTEWNSSGSTFTHSFRTASKIGFILNSLSLASCSVS